MAQRILLAEDEPNIVESLRFLLGRAGYTVDVRDNGRLAYEAAIADPPDLVILDVMLPEMDGFEILKRLRAHPATARMAILMLTAKGQREDRERAIATGASQFISKPFGNAELVDAVNSLAEAAAAMKDNAGIVQRASGTGSGG